MKIYFSVCILTSLHCTLKLEKLQQGFKIILLKLVCCFAGAKWIEKVSKIVLCNKNYETFDHLSTEWWTWCVKIDKFYAWCHRWHTNWYV